jgi:uncharacterized membrane protein
MAATVLYLGDTRLDAQAAYLAGVMTHHGIDFDYRDSATPITAGDLAGRKLIVLSDYPFSSVGGDNAQEISRLVQKGVGLLMIGGWESFAAEEAGFRSTPVAELLPVLLNDHDDRINSARVCLARKVADHPILRGLPWDRPPTVAGFNRFRTREDATTVLELERHIPIEQPDGLRFEREDVQPMLVVGQAGAGRTAAFASDAAPHWVGGLVDWGESRVRLQKVEFGHWYGRFFAQLLQWCAGE